MPVTEADLNGPTDVSVDRDDRLAVFSAGRP